MKSSRISKTLANKTLARTVKRINSVKRVYVIINGVVEYCS
jgi:hypothetical protein